MPSINTAQKPREPPDQTERDHRVLSRVYFWLTRTSPGRPPKFDSVLMAWVVILVLVASFGLVYVLAHFQFHSW
jgi:hypothetical protein